MRYPIPNICLLVRAIRESRTPAVATFVVVDTGRFTVLTLAPLKRARLMGKGREALWESRVHAAESPDHPGLGAMARYAVLDSDQKEALARHESLVSRLEAGSFEAETAREVLASIRPLLDRGAETFKQGDLRGAMAALEEAIGVASRMDATFAFLHLYQEAYLMRALTLEQMDPEAAKGAYREFISLYAGHPSHHPDTLRGAARAREAVERLTPIPDERRSRRILANEPAVEGLS